MNDEPLRPSANWSCHSTCISKRRLPSGHGEADLHHPRYIQPRCHGVICCYQRLVTQENGHDFTIGNSRHRLPDFLLLPRESGRPFFSGATYCLLSAEDDSPTNQRGTASTYATARSKTGLKMCALLRFGCGSGRLRRLQR